MCDFGSAFRETDPDNDVITTNTIIIVVFVILLSLLQFLVVVKVTPYLVSRFYRAPEITLGLPCNNYNNSKNKKQL